MTLAIASAVTSISKKIRSYATVTRRICELERSDDDARIDQILSIIGAPNILHLASQNYHYLFDVSSVKTICAEKERSFAIFNNKTHLVAFTVDGADENKNIIVSIPDADFESQLNHLIKDLERNERYDLLINLCEV
jgi:hypothetical protein